MAKLTVKYLVTKRKRGKAYHYWQPKARYKVNGEWVDCPLGSVSLPGDEAQAVIEANEMNKALAAWRRGGDMFPGLRLGTFDWLMTQYRKDSSFTKLAPGTQALYLNVMKTLSAKLGDFPADKITKDIARTNIYLALDPNTRKASQAMQVARVIFSYGMDFKELKFNPFDKQKVEKYPARQGIISKADIQGAKTKALALGLKSIAMAIHMGSDTGQRPGDLRKIPLTAYDGKWLKVVQSKTKAVVEIPIFKLPELKAELDAITHDSVLILHEERTRKSYSKDMLCTRVREVFKAAGLGDDVQFRDLRRTAVVRLAEAGCTIPEICAITGHSLSDGAKILKVYLPLSRQMAENAIDKVQKIKGE